VVIARSLTKEYPYAGASVHAIRGVEIEIRRGEFIAIVGPSGCGKSTLLNLIAGIDEPTSGEVVLLGQPLASLSESARSRLRLRDIGFVFQRFHLLSALTAAENIELPMAEAGLARRDRQQRVRELLEFVGLSHRSHHRPPQLSGGEQQRVAVARALGNHPRILLADEPTGELDGGTGEEIIRLLVRLNRERRTTLVVVTHDRNVARRAGRIMEMQDGRVASST
jgi:putative ABC transport system ATP-binding protein